MKNLINFYAPIWLLVLGLVFGLWGCQEDASEEFDNPNALTIGSPMNLLTMNFVIADSSYTNLMKGEGRNFYDPEYIYLETFDKKHRDNLSKRFQNRSHAPVYEGWVFESKLLAQIAKDRDYEPKCQKPEYANKPLYLHLSPIDIDTLMWNPADTSLYHNGKKVNKFNALLKSTND
ncbi:hypothetical protein ACE193_03320 [Bernardetia sp. OM2101]|uniref:hypothetical protein n=1 Tax=Bernardetia sp. OM2101 TaxID=3344876 RepID=UPI0035CEF3F2